MTTPAVAVSESSEFEMAQLLISALDLEGVEPASIAPEAPLFGHDVGGLGLDSIDALEIALAVEQKYGVVLRADDRNSKQIFSSLRDLTRHVQSFRKT